MPTRALWSWNHISNFHSQRNRKPSKPQSWKKSVVSGGCQCFTQQIKSHSHEWTGAQVGHRCVCRPWRQLSVIARDPRAKGEIKGEREVSEPLLEPLLTVWIFWNHGEDSLQWVWVWTEKDARKKQRWV